MYCQQCGKRIPIWYVKRIRKKFGKFYITKCRECYISAKKSSKKCSSILNTIKKNIEKSPTEKEKSNDFIQRLFSTREVREQSPEPNPREIGSYFKKQDQQQEEQQINNAKHKH